MRTATHLWQEIERGAPTLAFAYWIADLRIWKRALMRMSGPCADPASLTFVNMFVLRCSNRGRAEGVGTSRAASPRARELLSTEMTQPHREALEAL